MRILLFATAYNGLTQRAHIELTSRGHEVSIELATGERAMIEAVDLFAPELILCPFLKERVPTEIWRNHTCIIIHPGIKGDRGPSSLDWAIENQEATWGVTALEAVEEMDAGDIWATSTFPMRPACKSSIYRLEVTEAAIDVILQTVERFQTGRFCPEPLDPDRPDIEGKLRPMMKQKDRKIDWNVETTAEVVRKVRAADSSPGVRDEIFGLEVLLYGAHAEDTLRGEPGEVIAQRHGAICRATVDGAVWISHLKRPNQGGKKYFKLPATKVLGAAVDHVPESPIDLLDTSSRRTFREIWYRQDGQVGFLCFDFYNGAMSTEQCLRLKEAVLTARTLPIRVLVLQSGRDFWSNGIHLNVIEGADDPADESWRNINAIDDLVQTIHETQSLLTVAAVGGNAGAGGAILALAADRVVARDSVLFNPHYKTMGLFGSEYWTYLLPKRVGTQKALELTERCLPIGMAEAVDLGMVDAALPSATFEAEVWRLAEGLAVDGVFEALLRDKQQQRRLAEERKPLAAYRAEELAEMKRNFYDADSRYHQARREFVYKSPAAETPVRLAKHRDPNFVGTVLTGQLIDPVAIPANI